MIKNQNFKEKLIQINILKNKKIHAFVHFKEAHDSNQSIPIYNKAHTYDVGLVDPQNYELEEKPIGSLPCINFTNVKDFEQTHVLGNIIDKNVLYNNKISLNEISSIKSFSESSIFLRPYGKMSNKFIESYSFQYDFHDLIYAWLEESYLKEFPVHFPFFENNEFDLIFSIF